MKQNNYIQVDILCRHYQIEQTFFHQLDDMGLIQTIKTESRLCVEETQISRIEKIVRLYHDLEINPEGIDVILNLLSRIEKLEQSLLEAKNRLTVLE